MAKSSHDLKHIFGHSLLAVGAVLYLLAALALRHNHANQAKSVCNFV